MEAGGKPSTWITAWGTRRVEFPTNFVFGVKEINNNNQKNKKNGTH